MNEFCLDCAEARATCATCLLAGLARLHEKKHNRSLPTRAYPLLYWKLQQFVGRRLRALEVDAGLPPTHRGG